MMDKEKREELTNKIADLLIEYKASPIDAWGVLEAVKIAIGRSVKN